LQRPGPTIRAAWIQASAAPGDLQAKESPAPRGSARGFAGARSRLAVARGGAVPMNQWSGAGKVPDSPALEVTGRGRRPFNRRSVQSGVSDPLGDLSPPSLARGRRRERNIACPAGVPYRRKRSPAGQGGAQVHVLASRLKSGRRYTAASTKPIGTGHWRPPAATGECQFGGSIILLINGSSISRFQMHWSSHCPHPAFRAAGRSQTFLRATIRMPERRSRHYSINGLACTNAWG
jgi:hypothetical protein